MTPRGVLREPDAHLHRAAARVRPPTGRCSITGGYRYRGRAYRPLLGDAYLYGDLCSGQVWALVHLPAGPWKNAQVGSFPGSLSSFGESRSGELYATDVVGGGLYRVTARRA